MDIIQYRDDLTILNKIIHETGLEVEVKKYKAMLMPNDQAFQDFFEDTNTTLDIALSARQSTNTKKVLMYHLFGQGPLPTQQYLVDNLDQDNDESWPELSEQMANGGFVSVRKEVWNPDDSELVVFRDAAGRTVLVSEWDAHAPGVLGHIVSK
jgi:hypothetical protein